MKKKSKVKGSGGKGKPRTRPYPYEFRLKIVRLYLEEGYSARILHEHFGLSTHTVVRWVRAYRQKGPDGLVAKERSGSKPKLTGAVKRRIVGMKKSHPEYGPRCLSR